MYFLWLLLQPGQIFSELWAHLLRLLVVTLVVVVWLL